jgi:hypothetical protein
MTAFHCISYKHTLPKTKTATTLVIAASYERS